MALVSLKRFLEGKKKRRTAYKSGRLEKIGFDLPKQAKPELGIRPKKKDKPGRLIARTPFASRTRWRVW